MFNYQDKDFIHYYTNLKGYEDIENPRQLEAFKEYAKVKYLDLDDEIKCLHEFNEELDGKYESIEILGEDYFASDILRMCDNVEYLKQFELYRTDKKLGLV